MTQPYNTPNTKQPSGNTGEFKQELREKIDKDILLRITMYFDNKNAGYTVEKNAFANYIEAGDTIEQLLSDTVNQVLDGITEPTINDVFPSRPYDGSQTHKDMITVVNYYKAAIEQVRKEWS